MKLSMKIGEIYLGRTRLLAQGRYCTFILFMPHESTQDQDWKIQHSKGFKLWTQVSSLTVTPVRVTI